MSKSEDRCGMNGHRLLVVFDFDHSLVDENTDYYIIKLAPDQLPEEITQLYQSTSWICYMNEVFKHLYEHQVSREDILNCMSEIPFTEGMKELLQLKRENLAIDNVIISDSNSVFIHHILEESNLSSKFLQVFTNPAQFNPAGCLTVAGYHSQHSCKLSSVNLCKGDILQQFLQERLMCSKEYDSIVYVGDGVNDLCPGLTLREQDVLMPRFGFRLYNTLQTMKERSEPVDRSDLKASVIPWTTGFDIIKYIDQWTQSRRVPGVD